MQKQKRRKIISIFLIIYVISIASSWGYFFYQQDANYDKRVIYQFSSSNPEFSELYKVENRRLVNVAEESYIFPTDRLEYRFTIVNPLEHHIRVAYEFEVFRTGERIHDDSGEWYFQNNDVEHRQFEFSLPDEGRYDLKTNWIFYNETNGEKYAQFAPLERDIQVLSLANKLQGDSNQLTFQGLIAASVVGLGTITALILSVIFSKKETNLLEYQVRMNERPWITPTDVVGRWVTFQDGTTQSYKEAEESIRLEQNQSESKDRVYEIIVKNYGHLPAKLRGKIYDHQSEITHEVLKNRENNVDEVIMPNETIYFSANINRQYLQSGKNWYIGILLEYPIGKNRISKICKIWEITKSSQIRKLNWIDDPDMSAL